MAATITEAQPQEYREKAPGCVCPSCGASIVPDELAAQGYSPSGDTTQSGPRGYASHDEVARVARGGEPDDDDWAAQATIDDFNQAREGVTTARDQLKPVSCWRQRGV